MHQRCLLPLFSIGLSLELVWPAAWSFRAARKTPQKDHSRRGRVSRHYTPRYFCGISSGTNRIRPHLLLTAVAQDDVALRTLGLRGPGSPDEIKRAFKTKVVEMHPDRQQGGSSELKDQRFREVLEAYARLTGKAPPLSGERKGAQRWGEKPRTPAENEAEQWYGKDASRARWSQETGYNPSDLESIWDDIGYNPYTGEYHEPKASTADWQQEVDWQPPSAPSAATASSNARAARPAATRPRPRTVRPSPAKDDDDMEVRMQILTYSLLAIACLIAALIPNLFSGPDVQNRLRTPPPQVSRRSGPLPPTIRPSMDSQKAAAQNSQGPPSLPSLPKPAGNQVTPIASNTIQQSEDDWSVEDYEARQAAEIQRWVDRFEIPKGALRLEPEIASRIKYRG